MSEYVHLTAVVNDEIKDLLVSKEEYEDCESDPANFFVPGAENPENQGTVYLQTIDNRHVLPESFGV